MPKDQVFACLDAISNRYGREAAAYDKKEGEVDFAAIDGDDDQLRAMGISVVKA